MTIVRDTWTEKFFEALAELVKNCPTARLNEELRRQADTLTKFSNDPGQGSA